MSDENFFIDDLNRQAMDGILGSFKSKYIEKLREIVYTAAEPLIQQTAEEATKAISMNIRKYSEPSEFAPRILFSWYRKDEAPGEKHYKIINIDEEKKIVCLEEQDKPWWIDYKPKEESENKIV